MGINTVRYKIKNRWINTDRYDENGDEILLVNPDPVVVILEGRWSQRTNMSDRHVEHELFRTSANSFRELTGIVVYGGDVCARGITKARISDDVHTRILARSESTVRKPKMKTRNDIITAAEAKRLRAIRDGNPLVRKDVKPIRRRRQ
jgi:hypothetical protein